MRSEKRGGMMEVTRKESIGGNAGASHLGINFYYNKETGEIIYFGNIQHVPKYILENELYVGGTFSYYVRLGVIKKVVFSEERIDQIIYNKRDTKSARINLALTAGLYNKLHGGYKEEKIAA